jgi:hypothetical protein
MGEIDLIGALFHRRLLLAIAYRFRDQFLVPPESCRDWDKFEQPEPTENAGSILILYNNSYL